MAKITAAGLALIAQLQADVETLVIDRMIYANIDGLDPDVEPPDTEVKPAENDIVRESVIASAGYVNPNTVVYSDVLDAAIGDFSFNWIGLFCTEHNTLIAVTYVPLQSKRATAGFNIGNTLCKNFAINYTDIQDLTEIVIEAAIWQQDFTSTINSAGKTGISFTDTKPDNTLWIDGSELPADAAYDALNTYLNGIYGTGPGGRSYLPPAKGYFLRITDGGAGIDPDVAGRTDRGDGTSGNNVGTRQDDSIEAHKHISIFGGGNSGLFGQADSNVYLGTGNTEDWDNKGYYTNDGSNYDGMVNAAGVIGSETRPKNINVRIYIYY
ncbi:MAG: phage tail protein [Victivallaceae bacterium]|nr:phage tail protein [Victivallaceae bacterium]